NHLKTRDSLAHLTQECFFQVQNIIIGAHSRTRLQRGVPRLVSDRMELVDSQDPQAQEPWQDLSVTEHPATSPSSADLAQNGDAMHPAPPESLDEQASLNGHEGASVSETTDEIQEQIDAVEAQLHKDEPDGDPPRGAIAEWTITILLLLFLTTT